MKYHFSATRAFWRSFAKLPAQQQRRARNAFAIFKENPLIRRSWLAFEGKRCAELSASLSVSGPSLALRQSVLIVRADGN